MDISKLGMKDLQKMAKELNVDTSSFNSKADFVNGIQAALDQMTPSVDLKSRLPEAFNDYLKQKTELNKIRDNTCRFLSDEHIKDITEFSDANKYLESLDSDFNDNECRIVGIGNSSSGKSLFMNLILGEEVLPYTAMPCTSIITEIRQSKNKYYEVIGLDNKVISQGSLDVPDPREVLKPIIHLEGEKRSQKINSRCIRIYWPSSILDRGVVLVDSPGLGENESLTGVVKEYIQNAAALLCIVDSTQGVLTQTIRDVLSELLKKAMESNRKLDTNSVMFICNKWDLIEPSQKEEVLESIKTSARRCWSEDVQDNQFITMDTLTAFKAKKTQNRDTSDAINLKKELLSFLEKSFRYKLYNLWQTVDLYLERVEKFVRTNLNVWQKSSVDRQGILIDATERIKKIKEMIQPNDPQFSLVQDAHKKMNINANKKLEEYLRSSKVNEAVIKWAKLYKADSTNFPNKFLEDLNAYICETVQKWEEETKLFANARKVATRNFDECITKVIAEMKQTEDLLTANPRKPVEGFSDLTNNSMRKRIVNVLLSPIKLPIFLFSKMKMAFQESRIRSEFQNDPDSVKVRIAIEYYYQIKAEEFSEKLFLSTEEYMKRISEGLQLILDRDIEQIEIIKKSEPKNQENQQVFQVLWDYLSNLVNTSRKFYVNYLRVDPIDYSDIVNNGFEIGRGAFSTVYIGTYKNIPVAIKELIGKDEASIRAFLEEEEALRTLKHKNIMKLFGSCVVQKFGETKLIFVTELASGGDLRRAIRSNVGYPDCLRIIKEMADGMQYIHSKEYIHRDLKPENIFLNDKGEVKIADLGLTRKNADVTGTLAGTPAYMAPEYLGNYPYDETVDVFSFGRISWELWFQTDISNVLPRFTNIASLIKEKIPLPDKFQSRVCPPELSSLLNQCVDVDRTKRPSFKKICGELAKIQL